MIYDINNIEDAVRLIGKYVYASDYKDELRNNMGVLMGVVTLDTPYGDADTVYLVKFEDGECIRFKYIEPLVLKVEDLPFKVNDVVSYRINGTRDIIRVAPINEVAFHGDEVYSVTIGAKEYKVPELLTMVGFLTKSGSFKRIDEVDELAHKS
jgi:hypothetical protein